jgi:hypothetical protein
LLQPARRNVVAAERTRVAVPVQPSGIDHQPRGELLEKSV